MILKTNAQENGTYYITIACKDKNGASQTPTVLKWTLTNMAGTVINERDEVNIASPTASEEITLSGADLAIQSGEIGTTVKRTLTVTGTLDSQPLRGRIYFYIDNYEAI
jgi:hypothetical protein